MRKKKEKNDFLSIAKQLDLSDQEVHGYYDYKFYHIPDGWKEELARRKKNFEKLDLVLKFSDDLKKMIRFGVPFEFRRSIWFQACQGLKFMLDFGSIWEDCLSIAEQYPYSQMENFDNKINIADYLSAGHRNVLQKFLHVLHVKNIKVAHAPLVPQIAATLLFYMEPSLAFTTIQAMIERSKEDSFYFTTTKDMFVAHCECVTHLARKHCPKVYNHAKSLNISLAQVAMALLPTFFVPFPTLPVAMTFFDSFTLEGRKVMVRLIVGLLREAESKLLNTNDIRSFISTVMKHMQSIVTPKMASGLIAESFGLSISLEGDIKSKEKKFLGDVATIISNFDKNLDLGTCYGSYTMPNQKRSAPFRIPETKQVIKDVTPAHVFGGLYLENQFFYFIRQYFPPSGRSFSVICTFRLSEHGSLLTNMLEKVKAHNMYVLVIKTERELFGAFLEKFPVPSYDENRASCSAGVFFTFSISNTQVYFASAKNARYITVARDMLSIGGPRPSICIDEDMRTCMSYDCETFDSPQLAENTFSRIIDVELYEASYHSLAKV